MQVVKSGLIGLGGVFCVAALTGTATAHGTIGGSQATGVTPVVEGSPAPDSVEVEEEDFKTDEEAAEDDVLMDGDEFERPDLADDEHGDEDSDGELEQENGAGQEHAFPLDDDDDES